GQRDSAVMAPHLWHPALAFQPRVRGVNLVSPLQAQAAWTQVLLEAPLPEMSALFPVQPEQQDLAWASAVAQTLSTVKTTLGAGGYTLASAAEVLAELDDPARWQNLATLEQQYLALLEEWGLVESEAAKREAAETPLLPDGVKRVLVFAVADAPPLFSVWLSRVKDLVETRIFVQAPDTERMKFDVLGMPLVRAWGDDATVECPVAHDRMHRVPGAEDQARLAVQLLKDLAKSGSSVALSACDPALNSVLEGTLTAEGARVYNPAGRSARQHILVQVMRSGWKAARSPAWRDWLPFLRMDDVSRALCAATGLKVTKYFELLDDLHASHLPPTLEDAQVLCKNSESCVEFSPALEAAAQHAEGWSAETCEAALRSFLVWLYGEREFNNTQEHQKHHGEIFGQVIRLAMQVDAARTGQPGEASAWLGLVFDALEEAQMSDLRGEADLVLHGWLELLWEPAPGLVVTGFNDEHVPGTLAVDPFLPDRAKQALQLPSQATRRSRDTYLLRALAELRKHHRTLHVILGRVTADGDALRPSRLLLDASDEHLPARVKHLFPKEEEVKFLPRPRRAQAFRLVPPRRWWRKPSISPTALRRYLACPFRFYLTDVLGMRGVESGQRELSPADMGELVHGVFKAFADDEEMARSADAAKIGTWLVDELDRHVKATYGERPLFSVALQAESLRQRMMAFGEIQADQRNAGWKILRAEEKIGKDWGVNYSGLILSGTIDRIDLHEETGNLRIIDYKTSKSAGGPAKAHQSKARKEHLTDPHESWKLFQDSEGRGLRWNDLQLPLYVAAAHARWPQAKVVQAAYITLPATVSDVKLLLWEDLDETTLQAAEKCTREAVRRIQEGIFWPPTERVKYDDFEALFQGDVMSAVAPPELWREEEMAQEHEVEGAV
ncbi:MAG TPA: PD-(D/E)XK nuclease family protein, partial [Verrucomicrobium sp.]|nr:PD-(D/E)XK nuclease family protein [Verrucomicrobium sp.]